MRYVVTRTWSTNLEWGTWFEVSYADRPHLIAGFVFAPPFPKRLEGQIDRRDLWDYREVDGKPFPRWRKSMKYGDAKKWEDLEAGFNEAIGAVLTAAGGLLQCQQ